MIGAAPAAASLIRTFEDRGVGIVHAFGMTEATGGANLFLEVEDSIRKLGSMGRPTSFTEVRLRDDEGHAVPPGTVAEMQFRGPLVFAGYWGLPDVTAQTFTRDGWLCTGDLAYVDDDGYFFTAGRAKDMILTGGLNVYAAEVEAVLNDLEIVVEAAVVGRGAGGPPGRRGVRRRPRRLSAGATRPLPRSVPRRARGAALDPASGVARPSARRSGRAPLPRW